MSTLEDLDDLEREDQSKKQQQQGDGGDGGEKKPSGDGDAEMQDAEAKKDEVDELLDAELVGASTDDIKKRRRLLENELRIMKSEFQRLTHEQNTMRDKVKDNQEKIENNRSVALIHPNLLHEYLDYKC
jgi:26S proteasome regulatory subunit T5